MTEGAATPKVDRILWNQRPEWDRPGGGGGDIDEIVMHDVPIVHIEQMDDRCWWIAFYKGEGADAPYWMGNFVADSRGRMRFVEQENHEVKWGRDDSHEDTRSRPNQPGQQSLPRTDEGGSHGLAPRESRAATITEQERLRERVEQLEEACSELTAEKLRLEAEQVLLARELLTAAQHERSRLATADHQRALADRWLDIARSALPSPPTVAEMVGSFTGGETVD